MKAFVERIERGLPVAASTTAFAATAAFAGPAPPVRRAPRFVFLGEDTPNRKNVEEEIS